MSDEKLPVDTETARVKGLRETVEVLEDAYESGVKELCAANAEIERLTAENEEISSDLSGFQHREAAANAEIERLRAELAETKARAYRLCGDPVIANLTEKLSTANAENERLLLLNGAERLRDTGEIELLRAELANLQRTMCNDLRAHYAETQLAAANALLVRARDMQADDDPFAFEIDAHLAGQPAALVNRLEAAAREAFAKAETGEHWRTLAQARTAAEACVLEVMSEAPQADIEFLSRPVFDAAAPVSWIAKAAMAELARREANR